MAKIINKNKDKIILELSNKEVNIICGLFSSLWFVQKFLSDDEPKHPEIYVLLQEYYNEFKDK